MAANADLQFQMIDLGDLRVRAGVAGQGPLIILVHGFPESWYSWRHQISPLVETGFQVCAIDVRGYGGSSQPAEVAAYDMEALIGDVVGVGNALSPGRKFALAGHDWGAPIVWYTAMLFPDRVSAVAGLSVPHVGILPRSLREIIEELFTKNGVFNYQHYFQAEGVAEAELEEDPVSTIRRFYWAISGDAPPGTMPTNKKVGERLLDGVPDPGRLPSWLTEADVAFYAGEFKRTGFRGALNRYRNHDRDFAFLRQFPDAVVEPPALFIGGDRDPVLAGRTAAQVKQDLAISVPNLRGAHVLEGVGHWTQQERAAEVTELLVRFFREECGV